ncbi:ATP-dependent zinc metalloprotease yme1l1 [Dermatophagoides farinae]|uniref:ATP-dependent zinc metalloprotease yme1l1 n=1 Tax=Dermatophagoides farinae TaxID=6954 RepID=A0A922I7H5_DERFA|nr:ATP-dependent zinc metalloprotease YME1L-like isoform X2 [Dermatophagoides farinae]KAH7640833.1 atp-dependent zinc metalloprotease yme1-like protein [Dermatophagoides farinae]KAH9526414.1 ATP-dependent zinc metalloprotease yme1l1 [Dermatophagoides farinae]
MSFNVAFPSLTNLNSQVLPSITHISSLLKCKIQSSPPLGAQKQKNIAITTNSNKLSTSCESILVTNDKPTSTTTTTTRASDVIAKIIDEKQIDFVIEKFFQPSINAKSNRVKIDFIANLLSSSSSNDSHNGLEHLLLQPYRIVYNSKKDTLRINNHRFKLFASQTVDILNNVDCKQQQRRYFNTKTHSHRYTGIGSSLNRRYLDNRNSFNLKLGSIFKKDVPLETEKLKTLFNDEKLTEEERQRIKIAFAEGYSAADPKHSQSRKLRVFNVFRDLLGIILILAILVSFMGGTFRRVLFGDTNEVLQEEIDVTFNDVKGVDEAKQELQEIVEFLKNPEKFSSLGGKLPKGVLLVGPPGTGKTLLARAVAGEAGVPFFHAAGPEFDEILVGQGAKRVRDLFATAKQKAPCVIFIDEIDSVGAKRTNSVLHPYANQTINQLLTEMDGFRQNEGVIVLGATNRRDDLDKALIRPGRFDVEIQVSLPDFEGRKEIIQLYLGKIKYSSDVDLDVLARGTVGFTGADLENLINQAALRAVIDGLNDVPMEYIENSRDKVLMGPEKKHRIPDEEANKITAYHEAGHALVSYYTKDSHPLHKVTIIPRGPSLGHTAYIPEKESYHVTRNQMLATMDTLMGGRVAEELIFGPDRITTGASSDLKKATKMATSMVKDLGMSEKVGLRTFDDDHNSLVVVNELSNLTSELIDNEIKRILQESYDRAKNILKSHSQQHAKLAEALLKHETLNAEEIKQLLAN